ncbi:iron-only hydrogenase system regulator [Clostridium sp. SYSU_GA19001]|uniref:TM1266 family iron-only hydrogenase system putative regulator n=1 Tax=Clostridium caldaquaticum TaxID=2940653 RepID=UPI002076FE04|nr:TM1266 family iron-only hydrogenase system putative regulator [Clostridium caldaquaticum]MCM8711809.1 iron-only hydrogenase system regulator [Clostridium caldaquaticum]
MKKIAVISAILEEPKLCQKEFNEVVSSFKGIVKGRMGIPFEEEGIAVISITVLGELNDINSLTGKLGNINHVLVKTAISKKEIQG